MKKILYIALTLFSSLLFAQQNTNYKVKKAEVYLSGAKIYTESTLNLAQGENVVIVNQITNSWLPNTVQAKVNGNSSLISVTPKTDFIQKTEFSDKEKQLFNQQTDLENELYSLNIEKSTLQETINLINQNNKIGNAEQGWSPLQVQQLADYYAKKILELKKQIFTIDLKFKTINEEKNKINQQLDFESRNKNKNQQQVELIIDAKQAGSYELELSYFINNCGWLPNYDIKAQGKGKPIDIVYRGSVWQTTGIDWKNVQIALMSNQPNQNQNRPILNPLFADFSSDFSNLENKINVNGYANAVSELQSLKIQNGKSDKGEIEKREEPIAFVNNSDVNISYELNGNHDVLSDGTHKILIVDNKQIDGKFTYHSVPKLDEKVYLLAYLKNWNALNFMQAEANIYYQNNFIGKINIDPNFSGEEYPLSLGADNRISIKRTKNKDLSAVKWLSSNKKEEFSYDITVRNNTNADIELEILDQVPLSNQKDIEIELTEQGKADYLKEKGFLFWKLPLKAGISQKVNFTYQINSPKDKTLQFTN